jgi:hypothetical protein
MLRDGGGLDDNGVAYALVMSIVFIVAMSIIMALLAPMINGLIGAENTLASQGDVSVQTHQAFNWNVGAFVLIPFFLILGLLYWAVIRTTEQTRYGG